MPQLLCPRCGQKLAQHIEGGGILLRHQGRWMRLRHGSIETNCPNCGRVTTLKTQEIELCQSKHSEAPTSR